MKRVAMKQGLRSINSIFLYSTLYIYCFKFKFHNFDTILTGKIISRYLPTKRTREIFQPDYNHVRTLTLVIILIGLILIFTTECNLWYSSAFLNEVVMVIISQ